VRRCGTLLALILCILGNWALITIAATAHADVKRPVFLIAVPDLRWNDLPSVPVLNAFADYAAPGVMSVRSEGAATRCGDGLLELSAGTRVASGVRSCDLDPASLSRLRDHYRHNRYGAHVGTLADTLPGPLIAVGPAATALLTRSDGTPPLVRTSFDDAFNVSATGFVATVDDQLYTDPDRKRAQADLDKAVTAEFKATPPGAIVVVAGISDGPSGGPHLHPLLIAGQGFAHRQLTSPTTGRSPYVQLIDVLPTLDAIRGQHRVPASVAGRDVVVTDQRVPHLSSYTDLDRHATASLSVGHPTMTVLCAVLLGVLLLVAFGRREALWPARLLLLAPFAVELVQVVPWWRWGIGAYAAVVAGIAVAGAVAATWFDNRRVDDRRRDDRRPDDRRPVDRLPRRSLLFAAALTGTLLLADQLVGAPLQMNGAFGDNALVAGRFHGMGNIDFGLTMAAVLVSAAVIAVAQRTRRRAVIVAPTLLLVALVIDALPGLGDDLGGVIALLPAAALLVALVARIRLTVPRVALVIVAAIAAGIGAALLDYARPATRQTHAGRFVGQVLHGGAWQVVHRKLDAVLGSVDNPVVTATVVVAVVVAVVLHRRYTTPPAIAIAVVSVGVLALAGSLLNDSGVFVAAAALLVVGPPVLATVIADADERDTEPL